jgi:hypothetical protein
MMRMKVQDMFSLKGKVAVVTGGSSGLGSLLLGPLRKLVPISCLLLDVSTSWMR